MAEAEKIAEPGHADPDMIRPRIQDPNWADSMACTNAPDSLEPKPKSGRGMTLTDEEADLLSLYCGACPVVADCLTNALQRGLKSGIQGGLSQKQRIPLHEWYEDKNKQRLIPRNVWSSAIASAANLAASHSGSQETLRRYNGVRKKITRLLETSPDGSFSNHEDNTFFQAVAKEIHASSVLVRKQIFAMGREGVITAKAHTRGKAVHIASIALKQSAQESPQIAA